VEVKSIDTTCPACGAAEWTWVGPGVRKSPAVDSGQIWHESGNVYRCRCGQREWFAGEALKPVRLVTV
jgi:hypothetical protein